VTCCNIGSSEQLLVANPLENLAKIHSKSIHKYQMPILRVISTASLKVLGKSISGIRSRRAAKVAVVVMSGLEDPQQ
jgi:hypothetical protein